MYEALNIFFVCFCRSVVLLFHFCPSHCLLSNLPLATPSSPLLSGNGIMLGTVYCEYSDLTSFPGLPLSRISNPGQVIWLSVFSSRNAFYIRWCLGFIPALNSMILWGIFWPLRDFERVIYFIPFPPSRTLSNQTTLEKFFSVNMYKALGMIP